MQKCKYLIISECIYHIMIIFLYQFFSKFSQFYVSSKSVVRSFERKIVKTTLKNRFDLVAKKPTPLTHLKNHSKYGRPKVLKSAIYAPRSLPTVCIESNTF